MLFGTYQELPYKVDANGHILSCNPWDVERRYDDSIGFAPIWLFPITSLSDGFTHSLLSVPNIPEIFYFVETDNFLRLDKVRREWDIENDTVGTISDYIDDSLSDEYSEFVISPDEFKKAVDFRFMFVISNIRSFIERKISIEKLCPLFQSLPDNVDAIEYLRNLCDNVTTFGYYDDRCDMSSDVAVQRLERRRICYNNKFMFEAVFFPLLYHFYVYKNMRSIDTMSGFVTYDKAVRCTNEYTRLCRSNISYDSYIELYDKIKSMVITNDNVLEMLYVGEKIERNAKCPCGSGLKFKKCCGKWL